MKSIAKLLFIFLAATFAACSSDEPVKDVEEARLGESHPLEFDFSDINLRAEIVNNSKKEIKDYYGEISADGDTFYITHTYPDLCLVSSIYLNKENIALNQIEKISDDYYKIIINEGYIECCRGKSLNTMKFVIYKNDTGAQRNLKIHLRFDTVFYAGIFLTQESS